MSPIDHNEDRIRPSLPSVNSPDELDRRILESAHQRSNTRSRYKTSVWLGGTATVAILLVAVSLPRMDTSSPEQQRPMTLSAPSTPDATTGKVFMELSKQSSPTVHNAVRSRSLVTEGTADIYAASAHPATPAGADRQLLSGDLRAQLKLIVDTYVRGDRYQAQKDYLNLRSDCTGCELPETLQEASALYLNVDPGQLNQLAPNMEAKPGQ